MVQARLMTAIPCARPASVSATRLLHRLDHGFVEPGRIDEAGETLELMRCQLSRIFHLKVGRPSQAHGSDLSLPLTSLTHLRGHALRLAQAARPPAAEIHLGPLGKDEKPIIFFPKNLAQKKLFG